MRKDKKIYMDEFFGFLGAPQDPVCPLCSRPIPKNQQDEHHLIPRCKKGKITTTLHRACHRQIHMVLTEQELAKTYNSAEALLEHPEIQKFVRWIKTKPNDFLPAFKASEHVKS